MKATKPNRLTSKTKDGSEFKLTPKGVTWQLQSKDRKQATVTAVISGRTKRVKLGVGIY